MNKIDKSQYIGNVVADIMGTFMIPGGATLSMAIQKVFKKRLDTAREILLEEIKDGSKNISNAAELEEVAAIIYRYGRAAQEGAARVNLRMLANVIADQAQSSNLNANSFLYYAELISSLKSEEIQLLGVMIRENKTTANTAETCLKKYFTEEKIEEIFQSLIRTGLVVFEQEVEVIVEDQDDWKNTSERYKSTGNVYTDYRLTSLMLDNICQLIPFAEIIEKELKK